MREKDENRIHAHVEKGLNDFMTDHVLKYHRPMGRLCQTHYITTEDAVLAILNHLKLEFHVDEGKLPTVVCKKAEKKG